MRCAGSEAVMELYSSSALPRTGTTRRSHPCEKIPDPRILMQARGVNWFTEWLDCGGVFDAHALPFPVS